MFLITKRSLAQHRRKMTPIAVTRRSSLGGGALPQRPAHLLGQQRHAEVVGDVAEDPESPQQLRAALQTGVLAGTLTDGRHVELLHLFALGTLEVLQDEGDETALQHGEQRVLQLP